MSQRTQIERHGVRLRLDEVEHEEIAKKKTYEKRLDELQLKLLRIQRSYHHEGRRAVVVFEGWDAGGKGGCIRRLTEKLDPRGFRVHAIGPPNPIEQGKHYLYRFWQRLPRPGRIAVFDRSWYGRVLVERVEGFATTPQWRRAYDELNEFERMLIDDGVPVVKLFLHITKDEQLRRFEERLQNPYKRWKLTLDDVRNRKKWSDYVEATEEMFDRTSTEAAPWSAIGADHKWAARIQVLEAVTRGLGADVDLATPVIATEVVKAAYETLGLDLPDDLATRLDGSTNEKKNKRKQKKEKGKKKKKET